MELTPSEADVLRQVQAGVVWVDGHVASILLVERRGLITVETVDGVSRWVLTEAGETAAVELAGATP